MAKKLYQKNRGRDDDWIAEGELDESDLQDLGKNNKIVGLEFRSVSRFPERPIRHLTSMRRLKYLLFHSCRIAPTDIADVASLAKLESLWIEGCPVSDEGVEYLASHPKLSRVTLNNTHVTDAAMKHLATLPKLEWLSLDGTAISDVGLAYLTTVTGLTSLTLRNTKVTDEGILQLAVLPRLNLALGTVQGTAVTEAGLDELFAAQRAQRRAAKTSPNAVQKASATLTPAEIDAAKDVLYAFFKAMNEWQISCFDRYKAAKEQSATAVVGEETWEVCRDACREIFRRYCTPKSRAYGRPENISLGGPPDYASDPDQEPITAIETPSQQRIIVETKQKFGAQYRCQYVFLKMDGKWLIDSKKVWGAAWEWTIL